MRNDRFTHILFDLDGTLTDSAEGIINCVIHALRCLGKPIPDQKKLFELIGPPLTVNFHDHLGLSEEDTAEAVKRYRERYAEVGLFENRPYEGIEDMLIRLREAGFVLAVATSKPEVFSVRILEKFGLAKYFDTVCGSGACRAGYPRTHGNDGRFFKTTGFCNVESCYRVPAPAESCRRTSAAAFSQRTAQHMARA